jgi:hypothetical protein
MNPGVFQSQQTTTLLIPRRQVFLSSGFWVKPEGCSAIRVVAIGGAGGGGYYVNSCAPNTFGSGGAGGCGAVVIEKPPSSAQVTVGAGGAFGGANTAGSAGTASLFGAFIQANGGAGGIAGGTAPGSVVAAPGLLLELESYAVFLNASSTSIGGVPFSGAAGSIGVSNSHIAGASRLGGAGNQGAVVVEWVETRMLP